MVDVLHLATLRKARQEAQGQAATPGKQAAAASQPTPGAIVKGKIQPKEETPRLSAPRNIRIEEQDSTGVEEVVAIRFGRILVGVDPARVGL